MVRGMEDQLEWSGMYATQDDLIERFGEKPLIQLTDRTNIPAAAIDAGVVTAALTDATALIDGYLAKLYTLPLSAVPPVLTRIAGDIAWYYLNGERAEKDGPEFRNYQIAVKWLQDVAKGVVTLEADGVPTEEAGGGSVRVAAPTRIFSRDSLKGL